jgi:hypothetical protein
MLVATLLLFICNTGVACATFVISIVCSISVWRLLSRHSGRHNNRHTDVVRTTKLLAVWGRKTLPTSFGLAKPDIPDTRLYVYSVTWVVIHGLHSIAWILLLLWVFGIVSFATHLSWPFIYTCLHVYWYINIGPFFLSIQVVPWLTLSHPSGLGCGCIYLCRYYEVGMLVVLPITVPLLVYTGTPFLVAGYWTVLCVWSTLLFMSCIGLYKLHAQQKNHRASLSHRSQQISRDVRPRSPTALRASGPHRLRTNMSDSAATSTSAGPVRRTPLGSKLYYRQIVIYTGLFVICILILTTLLMIHTLFYNGTHHLLVLGFVLLIESTVCITYGIHCRRLDVLVQLMLYSKIVTGVVELPLIAEYDDTKSQWPDVPPL